jgi:hypothetical protein
MRLIKSEERTQIESDQVLTAISQKLLRTIEEIQQASFYDSDKDAAILSGLEIAHVSGMDISISGPAAVMQNIPGHLKVGTQASFSNLTVPPADPAHPRLDVVEARVNIVSTKTDSALRKIVDPSQKKFTYVTGDREYEIIIDVRINSGTPAPSPVAPSPTAGTSAILQGTIAHPPTLDMTDDYILDLANGIDGEFSAVNLRGAVTEATTLAEIESAINNVFGSIMSVDGSNQFVITDIETGEESFFQIREYVMDNLDAREKLFGTPQIAGYRDEYTGENPWFKIGEILVPSGVTVLSPVDILPISGKVDWTADDNIEIVPAYNNHRDSTDLDHPDKSIRLRHLSDEVVRSLEAKDIRASELRLQMDQQSIQILDLKLTQSYLLQFRSIQNNHIIDAYFDYSREGHFDEENILPAKVVTDRWEVRDGDPQYKPGKLKPRRKYFHGEFVEKINIDTSGYPYKGGESWDAVNNVYWRITNNGDNQTGILLRISEHRHRGREAITGQWVLSSGGVGTFWSGIEVVAKSDTDNHIHAVLHGDSANGGLAKIKINQDGTLSLQNIPSGGTIPHDTIVDGTSTYAYSAFRQGLAPYWFNDVALANDTDLLIIACDDSVDPSPTVLIPVNESDDGNGNYNNPITITSNQTGLERYIQGNDIKNRSITILIDTQTIYIKIHDSISSSYAIYEMKFATDFSSNQLYSVSEKYRTIRDTPYDATGNGGIFIDQTGELTEVISTNGGTQGRFINQAARKFTDHPEGTGIVGIRKIRDASWNDLVSPRGLHEKDDGTLYTFDLSGGTVYLHRQKSDGTVNVSIVTNINEGIDITMDAVNDKIWFTVIDVGGKREFYFGTLSTIDTRLDTDVNIVGGVDMNVVTVTTNNLDVITWIVYVAEDDLVYMVNETDNKLDTVETSGVGAAWVQGVFELGAPITAWYGLTFASGRFYLINLDSGDGGSFVEMLKKSKLTALIKYVVGYIRPNTDIFSGTNIGQGLDVTPDGNLVFIVGNEYRYCPTQANQDAQALNTFFSSENILLSNNISGVTDIVSRHYEPEEYTDRHNVPDDFIMLISYADDGYTVVHMDEYLSEKTETGKDKFDPAECRTWHAKKGVDYMIENNNTSIVATDDDMIFSANDQLNGVLYFSDLKTSSNQKFPTTNIGQRGAKFQGTWGERNEAKGYDAFDNEQFALSPNDGIGRYINNIVVRTFRSDDASDYDFETPVTYVAISGNDGVNAYVDVMIIGWGEIEGGDRIVQDVVKDVFGPTSQYGYYGAIDISDNGVLFAGKGNADSLNRIAYKSLFDIELNRDARYAWNDIGTAIMSIKSYAYKSSTGSWRNFLYFGTSDNSTTLEYEYGCGIIDIDSDSIEYIVKSSTGAVATHDGFIDIDFSDEFVYALYEENITSGVRQNGRPYILYRDFFDSGSQITATEGAPELQSEWTVDQDIIRADGTGYLYTKLYGTGKSTKSIFSKTINGLILANDSGVQIMHWFYSDNCTHESIQYDLDANPVRAHYIQTRNKLVSLPKYVQKISKEDNVLQWVNGNTATWQGLGSVIVSALEVADPVQHGMYKFNDAYLVGLKKSTGEAIVNIVDYTYGFLLSGGANPSDVNIYDPNDSGAFDSLKEFRVVHDGVNVTNGAGMSLVVRARELNNITPPIAGEVSVDPARGIASMPYPSSHMATSGLLLPADSVDSIHLSESTASYVLQGTGVSYERSGEYFLLKCLNTPPLKSSYMVMADHTLGNISTISNYAIQHTAHFTVNITEDATGNTNYAELRYYFGNAYISVRYYNPEGSGSVSIFIDGVSVSTYSIPLVNTGDHNFWMIADQNGDLPDSKSITVYIDGIERLEYTGLSLSMDGGINKTGTWARNIRRQTGELTKTEIKFKNIVTWNHYFTNDPTWFANEDQQHILYGIPNGYKVGALEVGYHFRNESSIAFIDRDGVTEGKMVWEPPVTPNMVGIHFIKNNNAGGCKITIENKTLATTLPKWDAQEFNWYSLEEEDYDQWINLDIDYLYKIEVEHSGVDNLGANDRLYIQQPYYKFNMDNGNIRPHIVAILNDARLNAYLLKNKDTIEPSNIATFIASSVDELFILQDTHQVYDIVSVRVAYDSTELLYDKFDPEITYGSNAPDYNDNLTNGDHEITVKFTGGPPVPDGLTGTVDITYITAFDSIVVQHTTELAKYNNIADRRQPPEMADNGLELEY